MNKNRLIQFTLLLCCLVAAGLAQWLKPTHRMADDRQVTLNASMPKAFAGWREDENQPVVEASPEQQATLQRVYSETVSRTYVHQDGSRVMLALAYGKEQVDGANSIHRPEVCYPAQGFMVGARSEVSWKIGAAQPLPVNQLTAMLGSRVEPISYWMVVGDRHVLTGRQQKLAQVAYGLKGMIPDGLLFRVSTIGDNHNEADRVQSRFVTDLFQALPDNTRRMMFGVSE